MVVVIELNPLKVTTNQLMQGCLSWYISFEALIQLYFDTQQTSFDIRDLVVEEYDGLNAEKLNDIWEAIGEFRSHTTDFMRYFLGDKIPEVRYRHMYGTVLCLEHWKSDEIWTRTYNPQSNSRHGQYIARVQKLLRN